MNLGIMTFDAGTTLDRLRIVGNTPDALGHSEFIPELGIMLSEYQTPLRRAYSLGYVRGCLVGFGVEDVLTLREAETVYHAEPLSYDNLWRKHERALESFTDDRAQSVAMACGVLRGYKEATVGLDAYECDVCERRVVRDLDPYTQCSCGFFCGAPDCVNTYPHGRECDAANPWD